MIMQTQDTLTPSKNHAKESGKAVSTSSKAITPHRGVRAVKLRTLSDLRRFGAKIINQMLKGELEEGPARAYGYLLSIMSGLIQNSDLETRIQALEKRSTK